ncbi:MAG: phenylacetate-CoA oxygenase subunit PaaC [Chitinophagales bacterium]|nr:phenylacetate-CoA oxygenase subunit PaaC [Chitinophagales bacterium]
MNAINELLFKMADDALVIGHRNSEWTGIGPMLEEDLAFSSMAQDKIGHALALYTILHEQLGEADPDTLGFKRSAKEFKCCQLVELPIAEYDFSLVRHFLFDHAELLRYEMLAESSFQPLAWLAKKVKGEIKYHTMHADIFLKQLANGSEEANARLQKALNESWHFALGVFEEGEHEAELIANKVFAGEAALKHKWIEKIAPIIEAANLKLPTTDESKIVFGGRKGFHSEYLQPLLEEMTEVTASDPNAVW